MKKNNPKISKEADTTMKVAEKTVSPKTGAASETVSEKTIAKVAPQAVTQKMPAEKIISSEEKPKRGILKKIILILVILVLIVILIIGGKIILGWNAPYYERESATLSAGLENLPKPLTETAILALSDGSIEGSLSYPSEFIPPLEVCAENIDTGEEFCTYKAIEDKKYTYGQGYKITAPEGKYQVYARLKESEEGGLEGEESVAPLDVAGENLGEMESSSDGALGGDYKAYYSEFVICGLEYDCPSHNPVIVEVKAGKTTADVDPQDWYVMEADG